MEPQSVDIRNIFIIMCQKKTEKKTEKKQKNLKALRPSEVD